MSALEWHDLLEHMGIDPERQQDVSEFYTLLDATWKEMTATTTQKDYNTFQKYVGCKLKTETTVQLSCPCHGATIRISCASEPNPTYFYQIDLTSSAGEVSLQSLLKEKFAKEQPAEKCMCDQCPGCGTQGIRTYRHFIDPDQQSILPLMLLRNNVHVSDRG